MGEAQIRDFLLVGVIVACTVLIFEIVQLEQQLEPVATLADDVDVLVKSVRKITG